MSLADKLNSISNSICDKLGNIGNMTGALGLPLIYDAKYDKLGILFRLDSRKGRKELVKYVKEHKGKKNMETLKKDELNKLIQDVNKKLEEKDKTGQVGAVIDNTNCLIVSNGDEEAFVIDLNKIKNKTKNNKEFEKIVWEELKKGCKEIGLNFSENNFANSISFEDTKNVYSKFKNIMQELYDDDELNKIIDEAYNSTKEVSPRKALDRITNILYENKEQATNKDIASLLFVLTGPSYPFEPVSDSYIKEDKKNIMYSNQQIINTITSKFIRNFDAHPVDDTDFGSVWEDQYGSLWDKNPDESVDAKCVWESEKGKQVPKNKEDEPEVSEEGEGELGTDKTSEGDNEDKLSLDEGNAEEQTESDDLGLDNSEELTEDESQSPTETMGQNLDKALDTISKMYNKLAKIVENQ